jgi:hypothetical protein
LAAALSLLLADIAAAQTTSPASANIIIFGPDFFAESRPNDAYEMARRIPGFSIVESDDEVRGYSAAAGNVLIDGKQPASKEELEDILRRIPAARVARIELIRGSAPGIDLGGHPVVINVVTVAAASHQVVAEAGGSIASDGVPRPQGRLEGSRRWGKKTLEGSLSLADEIDEESGDGSIVETEVGGDEDRASRSEWERADRIAGTARYETPLLGGEASLDGRAERERIRADLVTSEIGGSTERAAERERVWRIEAGGRYRRPVGAADRLEALFLRRSEHLRAVEQSVEEDGEERFDEETETAETIGRLSFRRERREFTIDAAVEGALNSLASRTELRENGELVPLPGSDARVSERRVEGSLGGIWNARPGLTLEAGLRVEASTIRSHGAAEQERSFFYPKPRIAANLDWGTSQVRLRLERSAGQLDFQDFVASASLDRDDVSAGAVSLRPPRSWTASAAFERRFLGEGAIILTYSHEWIDDVVDRVAVVADEEIFDAVGNIGAGTRDILQVELTAPLSRLGVAGMQLHASVTLRRSRVTDPETGERRPISEDKPLEGEIRLTQDLLGGRLSWGVEAELAEKEQEFRFDELRTEREQFRVSAHVDYKPHPSWRLRLEGANFTSSAITEVRTRFEGRRSGGTIDEIERRRIATTPAFLLSVRKTFGA